MVRVTFLRFNSCQNWESLLGLVGMQDEVGYTQVSSLLYMSQMMTWQASHDSLNTRDKDLAVGKAYGMNG
jgi:hypothetical protein